MCYFCIFIFCRWYVAGFTTNKHKKNLFWSCTTWKKNLQLIQFICVGSTLTVGEESSKLLRLSQSSVYVTEYLDGPFPRRKVLLLPQSDTFHECCILQLLTLYSQNEQYYEILWRYYIKGADCGFSVHYE